MEYFILTLGAVYYLKKKRPILLNRLQLLNIFQKANKQFQIKDSLANDILKNFSAEESLIDKGIKFNKIHDVAYNLVSFSSVQDINKIEIQTDLDEYGGDTTVDLSYNMQEDALIIKGQWEMKNKHLIEYDKMFAKIYFNQLRRSQFDKINLIRICIKTNGHNVKLVLVEDVYNLSTDYYKAYVLDKSKEFGFYEIPLKNFKQANEYSTGGIHYLENLKLWKLFLEIESKAEGPFEVELKSIDFLYDHKVDKIYDKYEKPFFVKL